MATPPTFSTGAVLTAAQMNAVGMWLVKTQTVGTGVSSVTVSSAFSADYDAYRVVVNGVNASVGDVAVIMTVGSASAFYYSNMTFYKLGTGQGFLPVNNGSSTYVGITGTNSDTNFVFDIHSPFLAKRTSFEGDGFGWLAAFTHAGLIGDTNSYSSFTLAPGSGTFTGGTISVYGYRK